MVSKKQLLPKGVQGYTPMFPRAVVWGGQLTKGSLSVHQEKHTPPYAKTGAMALFPMAIGGRSWFTSRFVRMKSVLRDQG